MKRHLYGVLLVSGGLTHQENYAEEFTRDPRCNLVALTDEDHVDAERRELNLNLADKLEIPYCEDLEEALALPGADLVSVTSEPERRGQILLRCAEAGKHLYIDKPMTPFLDVADSVAAAAEQQGLSSQMFSNVTKPWAQRAKRVIESGRLGQLLSIHADCFFAKGFPGTVRHHRPRKAHYPPERFTFVDSKPELYDIGIYALGLVRWLAGREANTVYARTENYFFEEHLQNDVEDFGTMFLSFEGGLTATIAAGRIGWHSHPDFGFNQVHLIGDEGCAAIDAYQPHIEVFAREEPWHPPPRNPRDPMGMWRSAQEEVGAQKKHNWISFSSAESAKSDQSHFIDCLEGGRKAEIDARDAAALTELLLAGYKSAASGEVVRLPLTR